MGLWDSKPEKHLSVMGRNAGPVHASPAGLAVAGSPLVPRPFLRSALCTLWRRCSPWGTGASCHGRAALFLKSHLKLLVPCPQHWVLCSGRWLTGFPTAMALHRDCFGSLSQGPCSRGPQRNRRVSGVAELKHWQAGLAVPAWCQLHPQLCPAAGLCCGVPPVLPLP